LSILFKSCTEIFQNVIFVPGNNEYYARDGFAPKTFPELVKDLRELCKATGVIFLDNSYIETDEFIIFGSSWWSYIPDLLTMKIYTSPDVLLTPKEFNDMHTHARMCLSSVIEKKSEKKLMVVTHYCPTKLGTMNSHHRNSEFTSLVPYYFSSSEKFIRDNRVNVWIFGHTHVFRDFYFDKTNTRIISNADPRKRFFRKNFAFDFNEKLINYESSIDSTSDPNGDQP
jgi:predicted phosphohydrolase